MNYIEQAIAVADQFENGDIATWEGYASKLGGLKVHEVVEALQNRKIRQK